jgi:rod shape-determining protein MreB
MVGRTPASVKAVQPIEHGVIVDIQQAQAMLSYFIRHGTGALHTRASVMVCIPSGLTQIERNAVAEATIAAGASRTMLIEKALAAALGAGLPVNESEGSLVVDLGGGTSEVAVASLGGLVVASSIRVGGQDLDDAIVRALRERGKLLVGHEQAEALKISIGSAVAGAAEAPSAEVAGRDLATGLIRRIDVGSEEVRRALQQPLARIVDAVKDVLERTPPELAADLADRGLILVGGGALLPGFAELLRRETGLPATVAEEPLTTIARGAGEALDAVELLGLTIDGDRRGRLRRPRHGLPR